MSENYSGYKITHLFIALYIEYADEEILKVKESLYQHISCDV